MYRESRVGVDVKYKNNKSVRSMKSPPSHAALQVVEVQLKVLKETVGPQRLRRLLFFKARSFLRIHVEGWNDITAEAPAVNPGNQSLFVVFLCLDDKK